MRVKAPERTVTWLEADGAAKYPELCEHSAGRLNVHGTVKTLPRMSTAWQRLPLPATQNNCVTGKLPWNVWYSRRCVRSVLKPVADVGSNVSCNELHAVTASRLDRDVTSNALRCCEAVATE